MYNENDLTLQELSNIFCLEENVMKVFLQSRDFHLESKVENGEMRFPYKEVQKHLQSQYFI